MTEAVCLSSKLRDEALHLLRRRSERLTSLLNVAGVPDLLLVNEARLISRAAMMLDLRAWQEAEHRDLTLQWKAGMGVCLEDDCDEYVASPKEFSDQVPISQLFTGEYCRQHAAQHLSEMIMDDVVDAEYEEESDE